MEKELVDYYQKNIDRIDLLEKEKSESYIKWIRLIITILVGLLSVLVAFKKDKSVDCFNHFLFASILTSIAVGIISGVIFLYHQVEEFKGVIKFQKDSLEKRFNGDINAVLIGNIPTKRIFKVCKYVFYATSILTIVLLVYYGIKLDK